MTSDDRFRARVAPDLPEGDALADALKSFGPEVTKIDRSTTERHTTHFWLTLEGPPGGSKMFVKRYQPPIRRNFTTLFLASRVRREYLNSREALRLGIPTVPALGYAETRKAGVVRDQVIAFRDLGDCVTMTDVIRQASDLAAARVREAGRFARMLGALHDVGYLHLAASPRNVVYVGEDREEPVWIDHTAALFFHLSIRATWRALPDVIHVFETSLIRGAEEREQFLLAYAPDDEAFRRRAMRVRDRGFRSKLLRRFTKVTRIFRRRGT